MTHRRSRRAFLTGAARPAGGGPLRPPGARRDGFESRCDGCGDCAAACPEQIITQDRNGRPGIDFARGACTFCAACAEACPTGALVPAAVADWPYAAQFAETCLSMNGITCRTCQDSCDAQAIRFTLVPGGRSLPGLDAAACTGCGACVATCPVAAISVVRAEPNVLEAAE